VPLLTKRSIATVTAVSALLALLLVAAFTVPVELDKVPSAHTVSSSAGEAKARRIWVASFVASPAEVRTRMQTAHINAAWLESRSHRRQMLLGPSERSLGGYALCFTLAEGRLDPAYFFVPDDSGAGVAENGGGKDGGFIYTMDIREPSDVADLRLSLISSWHEPRSKDIRFVRQP
jgi:hypothetical protein